MRNFEASIVNPSIGKAVRQKMAEEAHPAMSSMVCKFMELAINTGHTK